MVNIFLFDGWRLIFTFPNEWLSEISLHSLNSLIATYFSGKNDPVAYSWWARNPKGLRFLVLIKRVAAPVDKNALGQ